MQTGPRLLGSRAAPRPPLIAVVALLVAGQHVGCLAEPTQPDALHQLPLEQLGYLASLQLSAEAQRPNESFFSFHEFRELEQTDCMTRLVYIMNETVMLRDEVKRYQSDISQAMAMFDHLLQQVPESDENIWFWLLLTSHERLLQKLRTYWSKLTVLALDQHHCFVANVRDVMLDAIIEWKDMHTDLVGFLWHVFAYGTYQNATGQVESAATAGVSRGEAGSRSIADGLAWSSRFEAWFERYTALLLREMMKADASGAVQDVAAQRSHHQDEQGSFVMYEFLRRKAFGQWAIDKGLLRGLIRHVWQPVLGDAEPIAVADFGAGGGHYSTWLNETGLAQSFAFDGTAGANAITGGVVQEINLVAEMNLWRTFDWVFCLEVGEHIPKQYTGTMLRNLKRHAKNGLVMSWSEDWEGIGHVNCLKRDEFIAMVQREVGFVFDHQATEAIRNSCEIDYIARSIAIFRAPS